MLNFEKFMQLWYALLQCPYVGFCFIILYWQNLLAWPWRILSWCSGWRVNICTNDIWHPLRIDGGADLSPWILTLTTFSFSCSPEALAVILWFFHSCCHNHLYQFGPRSWCATLLWASALSTHSHEAHGYTRYHLLYKNVDCMVHTPEPVCAQVAAAEP